MSGIDEAMGQAERSAGGGLVAAIADRVGPRAGVQAVFGEPVERGAVTVVPVARVTWGFGGGSGAAEREGEGTGGGAGVLAVPAGYIEIGEGRAAYRPIGYPVSGGVLIACAAAFYLMMRGLRLLWR